MYPYVSIYYIIIRLHCDITRVILNVNLGIMNPLVTSKWLEKEPVPFPNRAVHIKCHFSRLVVPSHGGDLTWRSFRDHVLPNSRTWRVPYMNFTFPAHPNTSEDIFGLRKHTHTHKKKNIKRHLLRRYFWISRVRYIPKKNMDFGYPPPRKRKWLKPRADG